MNTDVRLALMRAYSLAAESENQVIRHLLMYILSDGRVDGVRQPIEEYMAMSGFTSQEWGVEEMP